MFRAVLWDFGGVLTTSPFEEFNRYEEQHGIPKDFIRRVNAVNPNSNAWAQLESNSITPETFDRAFFEETRNAGHAIAGAEVLGLLSGALRPRMVEVLRKCAEELGLKQGCITNNIRTGQGPGMASTHARAAQVDAVMSMFEVVVESSVEGIRKPDRRIYEIACQRLGISPSQAVYLDDLGINCKPARALGMHSIKVTRQDQAIQDLSDALKCKL